MKTITKEDAIKSFLSTDFEKLTPIAVQITNRYYLDDNEFKSLLVHLNMEATGVYYNTILQRDNLFIKQKTDE